MWPFKPKLDPEREADRQMYLKSLEMLTAMVEQQTTALQSFMQLFTANGDPESRVMTDEEEIALELERRRQATAVKWHGES